MALCGLKHSFPGLKAEGFAISINTAKDITSQLIRFGKVKRAYLGLVLQQIDIVPKLRTIAEVANKQTLFISDVAKGPPADKAGIQSGDILVSFNDMVIESSDTLFKLLSEEKQGNFSL